MPVESITDPADPRLDAYRIVRDGELLRTRRLFVAEGRLVVRRAIEDGRYRFASVLVNEAAFNGLAATFNRLPAELPILVGAAPVISAVAGYVVHRGCLALVHRPAPLGIEESVTTADTIVVLDGVTNADNVGSVFRNAAAFGAGAIVLSPTCCDPLYRKAIRTSMAAVLRVPFARATSDEWPAALVRLREAGFSIVALTPREPSEPLDAFASRRRPERVALVVGTEGAGLSAAVEHAADYRVRIPITGEVDSLNLASAVAITLYRLGGHVRLGLKT